MFIHGSLPCRLSISNASISEYVVHLPLFHLSLLLALSSGNNQTKYTALKYSHFHRRSLVMNSWYCARIQEESSCQSCVELTEVGKAIRREVIGTHI